MGETQIRWRVEGGLHEEQIQAIHTAALAIIEETGVRVSLPQARDMLAGCPGTSIKEDARVCVAPERVTELLGPWPKEPAPPGPVTFNVSGYSLRCRDLRTGRIRPSTLQDLVAFTRIAHQLGARGPVSIMPRDVPQRLAEVATYVTACRESDRVFGAETFSDVEVFDFVQEFLHQVLGKPYAVGMHMLSPLAFDSFLLERAIEYAPKGARLSVGTMPMQGATCPVTLPGALAQACAEVLGGAALLKLLAPASEIDFAPFVYPFDMRHTTIVFGGPDMILANLAVAQVSAFYGAPCMAKVFNTMAKSPADAHMGAMTGAACALARLAGMTAFGWSGVCSIDEFASAELMVLQRETLRAVEHVARGFEFDTSDLGAQTVRDCAADGSFLAHASTVSAFRDQLFESALFSNETFGVWDRDGRPDLLTKARSRALALLEGHDYRAEPDLARELDRAWTRAQEKFG